MPVSMSHQLFEMIRNLNEYILKKIAVLSRLVDAIKSRYNAIPKMVKPRLEVKSISSQY